MTITADMAERLAIREVVENWAVWLFVNLVSIGLFAVKGLIVIDMIDAGTGQVIWRGWDSKFVGKEENPREILKSTISGILSLYPPQ